MTTPRQDNDEDVVEADVEIDPDGDPEALHPRDLRGIASRDGVAVDVEDSDGDPEELNPHGT